MVLFQKLAFSQRVLRALHEKQAGIVTPLAAGAAIAGGAHVIKKGLERGRGFKAGFAPGVAEVESFQ